jgi:hypothetical protein
VQRVRGAAEEGGPVVTRDNPFVSVSVCPPPCRMLLVVVHEEQVPGQSRLAFKYPVVAIRSKLRSGTRPGEYESEEEVLVIADQDGDDGVYPASDITCHKWVLGFRIVSAHWPEAEDFSHLISIGHMICASHGSRESHYAYALSRTSIDAFSF